MKKNLLILASLLIAFISASALTSCSDDDEDILKRDQPVMVSSSVEKDAVMHPALEKYNVVFSKPVVLSDLAKVTLNGVPMRSASVDGSTLRLILPYLSENKNYTLNIGKGAVSGAVGAETQEDILLTFSTGDGSALEVLTSAPLESEAIRPSRSAINVFFDQNIKIVDTLAIKVNGQKAASVISTGSKLIISAGYMDESTTFDVSVPAGAIATTYGRLSTQPFTLSFSTTANPIVSTLVASNASPEAVKVYNFLRDNYGKKIVSGTMANVNLNINEAEWVFKQTGKYPALNTFDLIHINETWIDYNNTQVVENWWNNKGLVSYMWHWTVPNNKGTGNTYKPGEGDDETTFDVSKINDQASAEYTKVRADLEAVAAHLTLLRQKNIPVIWRPLHEAAGAWFWWGAKKPEDTKALWKLMYETFEAKGLNNLIWVWTAEPGDDAWYPGDEYVDIVGRDIYNKTAVNEMQSEYITLSERYPNKIVTLSECGSVATISQQIGQGAYWSWFMPWYDYYRTSNPTSAAFEQPGHQHARASYWQDAFANKNVISRDLMPSFK